MKYLIYISVFILFLNIVTCNNLNAQVTNPPVVTNKEWSQDFQPFRICGNLYYVGSYELASYLITTSKGLILINTGLAESTPIIRKHIEQLGFHFKDIKILLTTQAHFDHVGAMAEVKKLTGAKLMADEMDVPVIEDGGNSDYLFGGKGTLFQPVKVDRILKNNDIISLGNSKLVFMHHPGHTKGSCSYLLTTINHGHSYRILIANIPTILPEAQFPHMSTYPNLFVDYTNTINSMKQLKFDIWVASHASQFNLHKKHKPGDPYNPALFNDRSLYDESLNDVEKQLHDRMTGYIDSNHLKIVTDTVIEHVVETEEGPPPPLVAPKNMKKMNDHQLKQWLMKQDPRKLKERQIEIKRTVTDIEFIIHLKKGTESFSYPINS
jgi:Zn-dependent hydrolases, including glyoxylases